MTGFTRRRLATRILLLSLSFTLLPALPALAAEGSIAGRVLDPDGQVVPRAIVIVEGPIATPRTAVTDSRGAFEVAGLPDGAYTIRASSPGLSSAPLPIAVADAGRATIDIPLRLAALDEALVVTATSASRSTAIMRPAARRVPGDSDGPQGVAPGPSSQSAVQ